MKGSEALRNVVFKSREILSHIGGPNRGTRPSYQMSKPTETIPDKYAIDGDMVSSTTTV